MFKCTACVCTACVSFQGIVKVGAVDADEHKSLGSQYGISGFPTIKIFGANKNKPEQYQGTYDRVSLYISLEKIFTTPSALLRQVDELARPSWMEP